MAKEQNIHIKRGEDVALTFEPTTGTSTSAWSLLFTLVTTTGAAATTASGTGSTGGNITVNLTAAQTTALTAANYRFDLWRTDSGSAKWLAGGTLNVAKSARYPS